MKQVYTRIKTNYHDYNIKLINAYTSLTIRIEQDHLVWLEQTLTSYDPKIIQVQTNYIAGLMAQMFRKDMPETLFLNHLDQLNQKTLRNWIKKEGIL